MHTLIMTLDSEIRLFSPPLLLEQAKAWQERIAQRLSEPDAPLRFELLEDEELPLQDEANEPYANLELAVRDRLRDAVLRLAPQAWEVRWRAELEAQSDLWSLEPGSVRVSGPQGERALTVPRSQRRALTRLFTLHSRVWGEPHTLELKTFMLDSP